MNFLKKKWIVIKTKKEMKQMKKWNVIKTKKRNEHFETKNENVDKTIEKKCNYDFYEHFEKMKL